MAILPLCEIAKPVEQTPVAEPDRSLRLSFNFIVRHRPAQPTTIPGNGERRLFSFSVHPLGYTPSRAFGSPCKRPDCVNQCLRNELSPFSEEGHRSANRISPVQQTHRRCRQKASSHLVAHPGID